MTPTESGDETTEPAHPDETTPLTPSTETSALPTADAATAPPIPHLVPLIEGYQFVRMLGAGGQGVVYEALQKPTKRKVAIKVLLAGAEASRSARRRFEREIELVAQLKDPNIISIFHSGVTADGRQYYVMDYVCGLPLHRYVHENGLALENTLELFATICQAVQYAHQRGIIHRDLKPSNILVDPSGRPKILDFGLAKQVAAPLGTAFSLSQQVVGTLPYMSPEQARGNPDEIDTRTDVYALGVILYELLTGQYPYPVDGQMADVLKHIIETPPTPPSRTWTSAAGITKRSRKRLRAGECPIDGELQTIVLKALAKERRRRYQSAGELGRDTERYLNGEAIDAKRDSVGYILRKQLRKYRLPATIAAAFVIVVTAGFVTSLTFWRLAEASARQAQSEATKAEAVRQFLQGMLAASSPANTQGSEMTVSEMLDAAAEKVEGGSLAGRPGTEAAIRATIGNTYRALGLYPAAEQHLAAALRLGRRLHGDEHADVAASLDDLAALRLAQGRLAEAEPLFRQALALRRKLLGDEHRDVAVSLNNLAELCRRSGNPKEAVALYQECLAIHRRAAGAQSPRVAVVLNNLALAYGDMGDFEKATPLFNESLAIKRQAWGRDHPTLLISLHNIGQLLVKQLRFDEAEPLLHEAVEGRRRVLGDDHPHLASSLNNLGVLYFKKGDYAQAEPLLREALAIRRPALDENSPELAESLNNLAALLLKLKHFAEAERLALEAVGVYRTAAANHPQVAVSLNTVAQTRRLMGSPEPIEPLYRESLGILQRYFSDERPHPYLATILRNLGSFLLEKGDYSAAEGFLRRSVVVWAALGPGYEVRRAKTQCKFGECLQALERYAEAEALLLEGYRILKATRGPADADTHAALQRLIDLCEAWNRPDQAASYRALLPQPAERAASAPASDVP